MADVPRRRDPNRLAGKLDRLLGAARDPGA